VLPHQRHVRGDHSTGTAGHKVEGGFLVGRVDVIEEDATDAAALVAVLNAEVVVAPLLETRIVGGIVLVAGGLQRLVEVAGILFAEVIRRQVGTTAEPPLRLTLGSLHLEVAVVEVNGPIDTCPSLRAGKVARTPTDALTPISAEWEIKLIMQ